MPKSRHEKELARAAAKREAEKRVIRRQKAIFKASVSVIVAVAVIAVAWVVIGKIKSGDKASASPSAAPSAAVSPPKGKPSKQPKPPHAPKMTIDPSKSYTASVDTNLGTIKIDLLPQSAPIAVNNFVHLADTGQYDGVLFHRISSSLSVIQGGDLTCNTLTSACGTGGPGYTFPDELTGKEKYKQGVVAMANSGPDTNGSQFFIVTGSKALKALQPNYTIFGQLADAKSLAVAQKIQSQPVGGETPVNPIVIKKATVKVGLAR